MKFGGYYFHLQFRPEQPDNARGAFTYTGQFSGNAFADFLLGYPTTAVSGIGRGDENGRTNWLHLFAQDDWRVRGNLTVNLGLRYEYNQHMRDRANRLSSVDYITPGGRFVIASDDNGNIHPDAQSLLGLFRFRSHVRAGWVGPGSPQSQQSTSGAADGIRAVSQRRSRCVRGGYGIFLNQWAYSVQTAFARNLPFLYQPGRRAGDTTRPDVPDT